MGETVQNIHKYQFLAQRNKTHIFQNIFYDVYVSVSKARQHPGSTQRGSKHITDDIDDDDDDDDGDDNHDDNCCGDDDDVNNHDDDHNGDDHVDDDDDDGGCSSTSGFH